jgi:hypothetical protein
MIVPLHQLARARSGDKGASANVGVLARSDAAYDLLRDRLTPEAVRMFFAPLPLTRVERYELPNLRALNFVLVGILAGGGSVALRTDAQGKALGQALLEMKIDVPDELLTAITDSRSRAEER